MARRKNYPKKSAKDLRKEADELAMDAVQQILDAEKAAKNIVSVIASFKKMNDMSDADEEFMSEVDDLGNHIYMLADNIESASEMMNGMQKEYFQLLDEIEELELYE